RHLAPSAPKPRHRRPAYSRPATTPARNWAAGIAPPSVSTPRYARGSGGFGGLLPWWVDTCVDKQRDGAAALDDQVSGGKDCGIGQLSNGECSHTRQCSALLDNIGGSTALLNRRESGNAGQTQPLAAARNGSR